MTRHALYGRYFTVYRNGHILRRHPGMALLLEKVGETIEKPEFIIKQGHNRLYYGEVSEILYMQVVAELAPQEFGRDGFIKTAYTFSHKHATGEIEWSNT